MSTQTQTPVTNPKEISTKTQLKTQEAINLFLNNCRQRGLSQGTIETRASHLKHFALAYPELPTEYPLIHRFLTRVIKKKSARISIRKTLLAFYSYLQTQNLISTNPIPPGKVGRPKKEKRNAFSDKLGRGGSGIINRIELHIYIHGAKLH